MTIRKKARRWFLARHDDATLLTRDGRTACVYFMGVGDDGVGGNAARLMLWLGPFDHDDPEWEPADYLHELGVVRLVENGDIVFESERRRVPGCPPAA